MRADEGDDQVDDCQDEADAENQAITPHLIARANDQCLPQLLIHIRRVQFNGQVQFVEPLEERAEAAHVAHAFRSDDGVAVVKLEHQHQFAWRILAGSQDDTADIGEGITQFFVFLAQQDDKRIGIEPQFLAQTVRTRASGGVSLSLVSTPPAISSSAGDISSDTSSCSSLRVSSSICHLPSSHAAHAALAVPASSAAPYHPEIPRASQSVLYHAHPYFSVSGCHAPHRV